VGDERSGALIGAAMRDRANLGFASRADAIAVRRILMSACASLLFLTGGSAPAQPTVTISPPQVKGQEGNPTVPSVATDQAAAKRIEEERRFRVNRIIVEGYRDPDYRVSQPQILEQRFATSLNRGSPELVAGKVYDGCHYDGSYFSCADPLSSALRNLRHALR
jgi:hypothetical protein